MGVLHCLSLALKVLRQLGPRQVALYTWHQLGLRTGYLRWTTNDGGRKKNLHPSSFIIRPVLDLPDLDELASVLGNDGLTRLFTEADEIVAGKVRLFGGELMPLVLVPEGQLKRWTFYEKGEATEEKEDIKWTWEAARFGWACTLGRAYYLSKDEHYAQAFWDYVETFLKANPPYMGPHWASAQEAALRLIAFVFAYHTCAASPHSTPERVTRLAQAIADHAERIPPTLSYARAQNNNHLLTEALGLYTAGIVLPDHPSARRWHDLGWQWFNRALQTQIDTDGTYIQHSTNYHRLMLQAALWGHILAQHESRPFPEETRQNLVAATSWLLGLIDSETGRAPNLGPNDSAYILPLTTCPYNDYRPALQAVAAAFLGKCPLSPGPWDEMLLWLQVTGSRLNVKPSTFNLPPLSHALRITSHSSWAYLRAVHFKSRPGHADQLHLDLWWRGLNIAQDAGTYSYNDPPPWDNALVHTSVHNTLTVNGQDQMTCAGRFLWLDWAQGQVISHERAGDGFWERLVAQHDGYRRLGLIHRRIVTAYTDDRWVIVDKLLQVPGSNLKVKPSIINHQPSAFQLSTELHWLLPDWPWEMDKESRESRVELRLKSFYGWITLQVRGATPTEESPVPDPLPLIPSLLSPRLVRGGELLHGSGPVSPILGWTSPTYGYKIPALSFSIKAEGTLPMIIISEFYLTPEPR